MNCCELAFPPQKNGLLKKAARLPEGTRVVLFQGRLAARRGLEELADSASYLRNAALVFMGDGPLEPELRRRVEQAGMRESVRFIGMVPVEQVVAYTSDADIGVIPFHGNTLNNRYATPNKLFEYFMAGLPMAVSNLPEMAKVVQGFDVGSVFDPTDPQDMARVINEVLDSPNYQVMARRTRQIAEARYNWGMESQMLLAVYDDVAKYVQRHKRE